jgi:nucleoside-diphosphate-sugar epimerase
MGLQDWHAIFFNSRCLETPGERTRKELDENFHSRSYRRTWPRRYIQQSIVMAYPDGGDQWLDETTPLNASPEKGPVNEAVIAMEDMVWDIAPEQLQWCILRGGNFVGPETMQDDLIKQLRAGQVTVPCDGHNFLSLVHVADMATAVMAALESSPAGSVFNIVDEPVRNGEYLDRLAAMLNVPPPPRDPSRPCPPSQRCSNQAARRILGRTPVHGIWPTLQ